MYNKPINGTRIYNNGQIVKNKIPTKNIIVISYDENLNNFYESDITNNKYFVDYITDHKYIVLCTQKSVSSTFRTPMHFPHVFKSFIEKYYYEQIDKKDPSNPLSQGLTDNYNIRIRIFKKQNIVNKIYEKKFTEIEDGSFRTYFRNTANKTAILLKININGIDYNIINTDLYSLKVGDKPMYNNGLLYKQQEFLAIIKDFKLYSKYADKYGNNGKIISGENIILTGSLKFNINPLKMTNIIVNNITKTKINTYLLKLKNSNKEKLKKYNELYKYLKKLINNYNNKNNILQESNISNIIGNTNKNNILQESNISNIIGNTNNKKFKTLLKNYDNEHQEIVNLLREFKYNLKMMNVKSTNKYERKSISSSTVGTIVKGSIRTFEGMSRGNGEISVGKSSKVISEKDRILYALKDEFISEYKVFEMTNKRTSINGDSKFITLSVNLK
jgi:hypothetical protein